LVDDADYYINNSVSYRRRNMNKWIGVVGLIILGSCLYVNCFIAFNLLLVDDVVCFQENNLFILSVEIIFLLFGAVLWAYLMGEMLYERLNR